MRISSVRLGTLSGRVTVKGSISCGYTGTRYGECGAGRERDVSQVHGGEVLARSSCARLARVIRLGCFYCGLRLRISFMRLADEEKKEEALRRVLLFRWIVAESSQSTCPDVCRRGHHWRYRPMMNRRRSQ